MKELCRIQNLECTQFNLWNGNFTNMVIPILNYTFTEQIYRLSKQRLSNLSPEEGSEQIRQLYLASNLLPYRNITYTQKGRVYPAVEEVLHGSLKVYHNQWIYLVKLSQNIAKLGTCRPKMKMSLLFPKYTSV
jgi:hypothetical protein